MAVKHRITNVSSDGLDLQERVVDINRVAKVVKGGRRFSFTALVVVGDEQSIVGIGYGKANEVPIAIQKGVEQAKKNLFKVPKYKSTITHKTVGRFGAGQVMLKPASPGTGVIAGGGVRAVLELAGVHDILAKSLGSQNSINLVKATVDALQSLRRPEEVAKARGLTVHDVLGIEKPEPKNVEDTVDDAAAEDVSSSAEPAGETPSTVAGSEVAPDAAGAESAAEATVEAGAEASVEAAGSEASEAQPAAAEEASSEAEPPASDEPVVSAPTDAPAEPAAETASPTDAAEAPEGASPAEPPSVEDETSSGASTTTAEEQPS